MSAYADALTLGADSSDERLSLAAEILGCAGGVVILEGAVALRRTPTHLSCEVIDRMPSARRCEHEFEVMIENGRRMLEVSRLEALLPDLPRRWSVIADYGTGTSESWPAP
jgi:hypothetical protein